MDELERSAGEAEKGEGEPSNRGILESALRESEERQAFLLKLSDALRPLTDAAEIQSTTARMLGTHLNVDRAMYAEVDGERGAETGIVRGQYVRSTGDGEPPLFPFPKRFTYESFGAHTMAARNRGEPLVVADVVEDPAFSDAERDAWIAADVHAAIVAALAKGGRLAAELGVQCRGPRIWTVAEVDLVEEVAERTWAAAERARAEAALRESEQKYRNLFETMGQGYCELELIRDADGRAVDQLYLELNPAFERLFGIPAATARGRRASDIFPALEPIWTEAFDRIAASGMPERIEHQLESVGRWFEVFVYPQGGDRLAVLYEEVTERKRAQDALLAAEERQRFMLALGDAMRERSDPKTIVSVAARLLGEQLNASRVLFAEFDQAKGVAEVFPGWFAGGAESFPSVMPLEDYEGSILDGLRAGRTVRIDDVAGSADRHADLAAIAEIGVGALISVPLIVGGKLRVNLSVHQEAARRWTDDEVALVQDVAERLWADIVRARTEAAIRDSEQRLDAMFQALPIGVALIDANGKVTLSNECMQRYLPSGTIPSRDAERAGRWAGLSADGEEVSPSDYPGARALRGEHVVPGVEMRYTEDSGNVVWTSVSAVPMHDDAGKITGQVVAILDITEQTRAEQALRESEQRFREFGEQSSDLLWIRDAETLAFEYISPAWERLYGVPREQVLERNNVEAWLELIHPHDREVAVEALRRLREGHPAKIEFRVNRPDGGHCWIQNTDFPMFDYAGKVQRIAGIAQDVTERKRAVEIQATLLAELQHRVRNVLAMVRSVVRRTSGNKDEVEDFVEHLEGRIDAMARTQTLLTRSPGAGVEMESLVRDEMVAQSAVDGKVTVDGPPVHLAPLAAEVLTLAVHELATNSVKYGALGQAHGNVSVTWDCSRRGDERRLTMTWRETGLPDAKAGEPGFGTELITERVPYELKGEGSLHVHDGTLTATIGFPLEGGSSILDTDTAPSIGAEV